MPSMPHRFSATLVALLTLLAPAAGAQTQEPPPTPAPTSTSAASARSDRLFLNFIEDATLPREQWWEGQLAYINGDQVDIWLLRGDLAFQLVEDLEVGGRVGFGQSDTEGDEPDGSGATDLDAWVKYRFPVSERTHFALGAVATVPTGDDSAGLGFDAFSAGLFGSLRHEGGRLTFTGKIGARFNSDGQVFGSAEFDGETSASVGAGVIWPWSDRVSFIGEVNWESERFEGFDDDMRALAGLSWRVSSRGLVRIAGAVGLSDGAPDLELLAGYAYTF